MLDSKMLDLFEKLVETVEKHELRDCPDLIWESIELLAEKYELDL